MKTTGLSLWMELNLAKSLQTQGAVPSRNADDCWDSNEAAVINGFT